MRGAKWATVQRVAEDWTPRSTHACKVSWRSSVGRMLAKSAEMRDNAVRLRTGDGQFC